MNKTNILYLKKILAFLLCTPSALYCAAAQWKIATDEETMPDGFGGVFITRKGVIPGGFFETALREDQAAQETESYPRLISLVRDKCTNVESPLSVSVILNRSNKEGRAFQISGPTSDKLSPLLYAIWKRQKSAAYAIAKEFPEYVNTTDSFGRSTLECYLTFMQPNTEELTSLDRNLLDLLKSNFKDLNEQILGITQANTPQVLTALYLRGAQHFDADTFKGILDRRYVKPKRATPIVGTKVYGFDGDKIALLHALGMDQTTIAAIRELTGFDITPENTAALDAHIAAFAPKAREIIAQEQVYITTPPDTNLTDDSFAPTARRERRIQVPNEVSATGVMFTCDHLSDDDLDINPTTIANIAE